MLLHRLTFAGLELSYVSKDALQVDVSLSNFGDGDLPVGTRVAWSILLNGTPIKQQVVATSKAVPQGELGVVASIRFALPDAGTTASNVFGVTDGPKTITVTAELVPNAGNSFAAAVPMNSWNTTLFPSWVDGPAPAALVVTSADLLPQCGFNDCTVAPNGSATAGPPTVFLARGLDDTTLKSGVLKSVMDGSVLVLVQDGPSTLFPSTPTKFKQAWWLGSAADNNAGTLVYDKAAPILGGMAPDRYADRAWYRMIDGAQTLLVDEMNLPIPGTWHGPDKSTYSSGAGVGCPSDFPYPTHEAPPFAGVICYNTAASANAGEGPCGSWCTNDVKVGAGCGDNRARVCTPSTCHPSTNAADCEAECDAHERCNAINVNASHGCCLLAFSKSSIAPPTPTAEPTCCGYWREDPTTKANLTVLMRAIDVVGLSRSKSLLWAMPVGAGHIVGTGLKVLSGPKDAASDFPEQRWVLDRLVRFGASLLNSTA